MRRVGTTALVVAALTIAGVATETSASPQTEAPSIPQSISTPTAQPERPPVPPTPDALPESEFDRDSRDCIRILPDGDGLGAEPFDCEQLPPWWWDAPVEPLEPYRGTGRLELLVDPVPS